MAMDDKTKAVIGRWAPRFISNGVPLTDFEEVTGGLEDWNDWCRAWSARAKIHEDMGHRALAEGFTISAAQHLETAGVLYHFAKFVFIDDPAQMKATHEKAVACRTLALPHLDPPGERVAIPYEGGNLCGILRKPAGAARPPVVVLCVGMDSAKEEMGTNEAHFLKRGLATLSFDGPGQGEGEYDYPIPHDYEAAAGAVADFIEGRDDLDGNRIGIWGVSFGGYYAPRSAAFDKRFKACISISGPFDFGGLWDLGHVTEVFTFRSKSTNMDEGRKVARKFNLSGVAERITCPLFIVGGELDPITPAAEQEKLAAAASGPVELLILEGGNHCANNLRYKYSPQSADWMAGRLGDGS